MAAETTKKTTTGKAFAFNLVGDDLHLYETVREAYEGEAEEAEAKVAEALEALDPDVRVLLRERMAAKASRKEMSHRQVFVRALQAALDVLDAAEDARTAEDDDSDDAGEVEAA